MKELNPYFSILVPVCNQEGKMDVCVNSLKSQTYGDFEVIMVDDGSKDASYEEITKLAEEDERFRVYKHDVNRSLLAARYTGMQHASGKYILFLDTDDYLEPDTCECLKNRLEEKPVDVLRFGFLFETPQEEPIPFLPVDSQDPLKGYMLGEFPPAIWKNCYSSDVIKKVVESSEPFYCNMGEDVCLSGLFFSRAQSFDKIDRVFHHYVTGEGMSSTRTHISIEKFHRDFRSVEESAEHLSAYIEEYKPDYLEYLKIAIRTMFRTVLAQSVMFDTDYSKAVRVLNEIDNDKYRELFEYGCEVLLPRKILTDANPDVKFPRLDVTK